MAQSEARRYAWRNYAVGQNPEDREYRVCEAPDPAEPWDMVEDWTVVPFPWPPPPPPGPLSAAPPPPPLPPVPPAVVRQPGVNAYSITGWFNYDDIEARPGILRGYYFEAYHRGHAHCGCMHGKPFALFMVHDSSSGHFPMQFLATYHTIDEHLQHNNLEVKKSYSYGWICVEQINRSATGWLERPSKRCFY